MGVDEAIASLRAVRHYTGVPVPDDLVRAWVDVARWCGSSKNSQPWRFVAVRDRTALVALSAFGEFAGHLATCDVALVVIATPAPYQFSLAFDLGRISQCLMLLAHQEAIGSCVAVFGPHDLVVAAGEVVKAPPAWTAHLAIGFGHPGPQDRPADDLQRVSPPNRLVTEQLLFWDAVPEDATDAVR